MCPEKKWMRLAGAGRGKVTHRPRVITAIEKTQKSQDVVRRKHEEFHRSRQV